ncbi:MAG: DNA polymerase IV [Lachnospiraceae bacterium]|nr:DNA polymerase IV [Lachnospiraceae bacterium]
MDTPRTVYFHIDVNSAFLSWESVRRLREGKSDLRLVPAIVGGDQSRRHGIVLAKSVPAKAFGIVTGEPVAAALRKCPTLTVVPGDYDLYIRMSDAFMEILHRYAPKVEPFSIDEAFLDMTGTDLLYKDPLTAADLIRETIRDELGFTVNVGIAENRMLAKMASDFTKPDRVHTLWPDEIETKIWPLPVEDLLFCGSSTAERLISLGLRTIGDVARTPEEILVRHLGKHGKTLHEYANGIDRSDWSREPETRSVSHETTMPRDVTDAETARLILLSLTERVAARLRRNGDKARQVSAYLTYADFTRRSRQAALPAATDVTEELYAQTVRLFDQLWDKKTPIRLIGMSAGQLGGDDGFRQMDLFDGGRHERLEKLDKAIDSIRSRYGRGSVTRASLLGNEVSLRKRRDDEQPGDSSERS